MLSPKDFEIDEKEKSILLTNEGINKVEKVFSDANILKNNNFYDPVSYKTRSNNISNAKFYTIKFFHLL